MSRIGKRNILIPENIKIEIESNTVSVKGPKGTLSRTFSKSIKFIKVENFISVQRLDESLMSSQLHGLSRTLLANLIQGVSAGFEKKLELRGVGYRAQLDKTTLTLNVGYKHPVIIAAPEGIVLKVENNTNITISGINKELVGKVAAQIRAIKPPEPYKGKGIRYLNETVKQKVGKTGKK
uniref:Ribosomal protein L6 n=1 Tax=Gloeochaete wittrockiana TaxID=38269 RepID=A0A3G1IVZ9_9EUKA|nr:ribosomal protein L6 [Gloeochaete wittrockiana]ASQ40225.1 ribosomal protein L6 [Gloeochaete wittrockiana]